MPGVTIPLDHITDRSSFHTVFSAALGFPEFYGRNMDAWIDCMSDPDYFNDGLREALATPGEVLTLLLPGAQAFRDRCPDLWNDLVDCTAIVNWRSTESDQRPVIVLAYTG